MTQWSRGPQSRIVRINGVWVRNTAVTAISTTVSGKSRVHLTHGSVDIPLGDGQTVDNIADQLWANEETP